MTPIIITLSLLMPSQQGRKISGTDLGTGVRFVVFIPDRATYTGEPRRKRWDQQTGPNFEDPGNSIQKLTELHNVWACKEILSNQSLSVFFKEVSSK